MNYNSTFKFIGFVYCRYLEWENINQYILLKNVMNGYQLEQKERSVLF
jgi:hypothetical protein